jgi:tRNA(Glu) U13 pseudouridine synthase TruD
MAFTLPASAYATMLFRELTRSETHAQYHAAKSEKLAADQ